MKRKNGDWPVRRGFTLVELLVAITIVAVLAVLVTLGMRKARVSAEMVVSLSRLRGYGQANISYAAEHNSRYVSNAAWDENGKSMGNWSTNPEFLSYIVGDGAYLNGDSSSGRIADPLPEALLDPVAYRAKKFRWDRVSGSYGYVIQGVDPPGWGQKGMDKHRTVHAVRYPERSAAFMTAKDWNAKYSGRFLWRENPGEGKLPTGDIAYRYNGKCLVVFYDGHTEAMTMEDMERIDDERGGAKSYFWDADGPWEGN